MQSIRPRLPDLDDDVDEPWRPAAQASQSIAVGERFELDLNDDRPVVAVRPVLVSDIKERTSKSVEPPKPVNPARKESRFKASLRKQQQNGEKGEEKQKPTERLHEEIDVENTKVLEGMSEEEVLEEQARLMEMLGPDMVQFIRNRGSPESTGKPVSPLRGRRSVRFNESVSYSNPPSRSPSPPARKVPIILPSSDDPTIGNWLQDESARVKPGDREQMLEEGTPEDIRRRFFPDEPMSASLDWAGDQRVDNTGKAAPSLRFTAQGRALEQETKYLDHSSEPDRHAGPSETFSLAELAQLAMSAVAGQRTLALHIAQKVLSANLEAQSEAGQKLRSSATVNALAAVCAKGLSDKHVGVVALSVGILYTYASCPATKANAAAAVLTAQPPVMQGLGRLLSPRTAAVDLPFAAKEVILDTLLALVDSQEDFLSSEIIEAPSLLENVVEVFLQCSWPPSIDRAPNAHAAQLLAVIISRSRVNGEQIWARRLEHPTLRYIAVPPWHIDTPHRQIAFAMTCATLRIFSEYANYGLACSTYSSSTSLFRQVQDWIGERPGEQENLTRSWFDLLESWSSCAIDPHSTTPEHDILWPETKEWGEHCTRVLASSNLAIETRASVVKALTAWLRAANRHDQAAFTAALASLDEHRLNEHIIKASTAPVDEEAARFLIAAKKLMSLEGMQDRLGKCASLLSRIEVESAPIASTDGDDWI